MSILHMPALYGSAKLLPRLGGRELSYLKVTGNFCPIDPDFCHIPYTIVSLFPARLDPIDSPILYVKSIISWGNLS